MATTNAVCLLSLFPSFKCFLECYSATTELPRKDTTDLKIIGLFLSSFKFTTFIFLSQRHDYVIFRHAAKKLLDFLFSVSASVHSMRLALLCNRIFLLLRSKNYCS